MDMITLEAEKRDTKVAPSYLRKSRKVPAVYYGHGEKNMILAVDYQSFRKVYMKAGGNQVVELKMNNEKKPVLIHEVQLDPLTDNYSHIDFMHVNMNEEITAMIPVHVVGIAPAVKDLGGILTTLKHEIEVRCLPGNLPQFIEIDVSGLDQLHSAIHIRDVEVAKEVKIHGNLDAVVLTVSPPKIEEEVKPVAEAAVAVEGAAAPAEGAAPASGAAAGEGTQAAGAEKK